MFRSRFQTPLRPPDRSIDAPAVRGVKLAVFDVDHTLVDGATGFWFTYYLARNRLISPVGIAYAAWWTAAHRLGFVDISAVMRGAGGAFRGMSRERIEQTTDDVFRNHIAPRLFDESVQLTSLYRARQIPTLLLSATGAEMVARIAAELGASDSIGNELEKIDGVATGRILRPYVYGEQKLAALSAYVADRGVALEDCAAFADSYSDLPLLAAVGFPHVVNPDRKLGRVATDRGWPILRFGRGQRS